MSDTDSILDRPGAIRDGERLCVPIAALNDEEIHAMTTSRITTGEPYELDDVAEDGTMLGGKMGSLPTA